MKPRHCPKCNGQRQWRKVKLPGANRSVFACIECAASTRPIKGLRKKLYMPKGLYNHSQKVKVANELWRHLIYAKATDRQCAVCGTAKGLQAMHIFPKKRYPHLRFILDNGAPGCAGCHIRLTNDHEAHRDFSIRYLGAERYEALRIASLARGKCDVDMTILYLRRLTDAAQHEGDSNQPDR